MLSAMRKESKQEGSGLSQISNRGVRSHWSTPTESKYWIEGNQTIACRRYTYLAQTQAAINNKETSLTVFEIILNETTQSEGVSRERDRTLMIELEYEKISRHLLALPLRLSGC